MVVNRHVGTVRPGLRRLFRTDLPLLDPTVKDSSGLRSTSADGSWGGSVPDDR